MTRTRSFERIKPFLIIFMVFCILIFMVGFPPFKAKAIVPAIPVVAGVALVAMACVAIGGLFVTGGDLNKVSEIIYNGMDTTVKAAVTEWEETVTAGTATAVITANLWNQVVGAVGSWFGTTSVPVSSHNLLSITPLTISNVPLSNYIIPDISKYIRIPLSSRNDTSVYTGSGFTVTVTVVPHPNPNLSSLVLLTMTVETADGLVLTSYSDVEAGSFFDTNRENIVMVPVVSKSLNYFWIGILDSNKRVSSLFENSNWTVSGTGINGVTGEITIVEDSGLFIGDTRISPYGDSYAIYRYLYDVLTGASTVTYGLDKAIAPDLPLVDADAGELELDLSKTYEDIAVMNPSDAIPAVPPPPMPPDMPDIDLPSYIFTKKFPFCLPYDLYNAFASLVVEPKAPVYTLQLPLKSFGMEDYQIQIDLSDYEVMSKISRWGLSLFFILGLILVTRKIIGAQ